MCVLRAPGRPLCQRLPLPWEPQGRTPLPAPADASRPRGARGPQLDGPKLCQPLLPSTSEPEGAGPPLCLGVHPTENNKTDLLGLVVSISKPPYKERCYIPE